MRHRGGTYACPFAEEFFYELRPGDISYADALHVILYHFYLLHTFNEARCVPLFIQMQYFWIKIFRP